MKRSWSQDGPKTAQERPRCANRRGGNKCNNRCFFHSFGIQGVEMRPRFLQDGTKLGGERRPRGTPNEVFVNPSRCMIEASWCQVGAKMKQQWSPNADTITRRRRKDVAKASPICVDLETTWGQVGATTRRRWPQEWNGIKSAMLQKCQNLW